MHLDEPTLVSLIGTAMRDTYPDLVLAALLAYQGGASARVAIERLGPYSIARRVGASILDLDLVTSAQGLFRLGIPTTRFPLLAEGWALLAVQQAPNLPQTAAYLGPPPMSELPQNLAPSIWTQFTPAGTRIARDYLARQRP